VTLYDVIADLRREHSSPAATQTLDMVVAELGRTRDNLKSALQALSSKPIPPGGSVAKRQKFVPPRDRRRAGQENVLDVVELEHVTSS